MKKIKKVVVILLIIVLSINIVNASEYPDVTEDIEIRYKWYKEIITGDYYPKKDIKEEDIVDESKFKYTEYSKYKPEYCSLSPDHYIIDKRVRREYKKVKNARYVLLENFNYDNNIKIYQNNKEIKFEVINNKDGVVEIDLKADYICETLLFFIENVQNYKISLYTDKKLLNYIISKEIENEKILIPDKTWITNRTSFINLYTESKLEESDLTTKVTVHNECSYREIYVYKYNIEKEYYDNNYHLNIDGYIKDTNNYRFYYKGEHLVNTIEITKEKIVKEPQLEYIYIETENNKNDSSNKNNCIPEIKTEIKEKIIEKEIFKIPKIMYIIISILTATVIILIIKIYKKYVVQRF